MRLVPVFGIAVAVVLGSSCLSGAQQAPFSNHFLSTLPQDRDHEREWNHPPDEFRDAKRQGFMDGMEAGHHDFEHHRDPDVDRRKEFRHPPVPRGTRDEYRDGFRNGYERAFHHFRDDHDHDHDHDQH